MEKKTKILPIPKFEGSYPNKSLRSKSRLQIPSDFMKIIEERFYFNLFYGGLELRENGLYLEGEQVTIFDPILEDLDSIDSLVQNKDREKLKTILDDKNQFKSEMIGEIHSKEGFIRFHTYLDWQKNRRKEGHFDVQPYPIKEKDRITLKKKIVDYVGLTDTIHLIGEGDYFLIKNNLR